MIGQRVVGYEALSAVSELGATIAVWNGPVLLTGDEGTIYWK